MRLLAATFALSLLAMPAFAAGYALDAKGKCHDEHVKYAKAEFCRAHSYKLDAKGKCHDESGKFAKADACRR